MVLLINIGAPGTELKRGLKKTEKAHWKNKLSQEGLDFLQVAKIVPTRYCKIQQKAGVEHILFNIFLLYDYVLNTIAMVAAALDCHGANQELVDTEAANA